MANVRSAGKSKKLSAPMKNNLPLFSLIIIGVGLATSVLASPVPVIVTLLFLGAVALFQWLWNSTVSVIVGLRYITYWEAFRLLLLCWLVIGSALLSCKLVLGTSIFSR